MGLPEVRNSAFWVALRAMRQAPERVRIGWEDPEQPHGIDQSVRELETDAYRIKSTKISTIPICAVIQHAGLTPIGPKA